MVKHSRQYTIRSIPDQVDRILKKRARDSRKSFNQVVLEALAAGTGETLKPKRDLSEVIGSLSKKEAETIDDEVARQRSIDPELWR